MYLNLHKYRCKNKVTKGKGREGQDVWWVSYRQRFIYALWYFFKKGVFDMRGYAVQTCFSEKEANDLVTKTYGHGL